MLVFGFDYLREGSVGEPQHDQEPLKAYDDLLDFSLLPIRILNEGV